MPFPRLLRAVALPLTTIVVAGACSGAAPTAPTAGPSAVVASAPAAASSAPSSSSVPGSPASQAESETDRLIETYAGAAKADSDDIESRTLLGLAYLQRVRERGDPADYGRAETAFEEALALDPEYVEALVGKGTLLLARHRFREALEVGRQAVELAPDAPRAHGVVADAQTELGMYDEALQSVQQMVSLKPDLASYSRVSYQRELRGLTDGAIEAMEQALRAGGNAPSEGTEYIRVLLGNLHFGRGDLESAERLYATSAERLPGSVWALAGMARVRAAQGRFDDSIALYQQAVDRIPLPEFVIALAETQDAAGRTDEARQSYELVRVIQGLFAENGVDVDLELAFFEADHGSDPEAAVTLAREAYTRQPNIKAADTLAWALHRAGQPEEARRYSTEALRLGTQDAGMLFRAGMIAVANGEPGEGRRLLTQAIEINPHFSPLRAPEARDALADLPAAGS